MAASQPPGTVLCLLCRGVISFKAGDKTRFESHVLHEHEAYFGLDVLLAISFCREEEREAIVAAVGKRYETKDGDKKFNVKDDVIDVKAALENFVKVKTENSNIKKEYLENSVIIEEMGSDESMNENEKIYGIPEKMMNCTYCSRTFINRNSLKRHEQKHKYKDYPCHKCDQKFSFLEDLKHHRMTHVTVQNAEEENIDEEMYVIRGSDVGNHHVEVDTSTQSYDDQMDSSEGSCKESYLRCKVCSKVMRKESYPAHKLIHNEERKYACNFCETKFRRPEHLKKHMFRCHKTNTSKTSLNSTEDDVFTFKCTICSKEFFADDTLKRHMKVHFPRGLKQHIPVQSTSKTRLCIFNCEVCGKVFQDINDLGQHTARIHKSTHEASVEPGDDFEHYMTMK